MNINKKQIYLKEYIYLDWNIFQYIKNPRNDSDILFKNILKVIKKKYYFPYSEGHLQDLAKSFKPENKEYIKEDLSLIKKVTDEHILGIDREKIVITKYSSEKLFEEILNEKKSVLDVKKIKDLNMINIVNVKSFDEKNPLYDFVCKKKGIYTNEELYLEGWSIFLNMLDNFKSYKDFRNYIMNEFEFSNNFNDEYIQNMKPFFDALKCTDEEKLKDNWENVIKSWLKNTNNDDNINLGLMITISYILLDYHPNFKEKLKKNNKLDNIRRDSKHIYFASNAKYMVSEDENIIKKAKFIYKVFNINTKVISMNEFITKFRDSF
ncbi:MAG: hypothetical protein ACLR02_08105 [Clostridium sp.]